MESRGIKHHCACCDARGYCKRCNLDRFASCKLFVPKPPVYRYVKKGRNKK
jgi:hypothetical protein